MIVGGTGKKSDWEGEIITKKMREELASGNISEISSKPVCTLVIFVVPKDDGGGRVVVDCSWPEADSVSKFTDEVCRKFSYI